MSETVHPQNPENLTGLGSPSHSVDRGSPNPGKGSESNQARVMGQDTKSVEVESPALVSFAGVMMLLLGAVQLSWAFVEFINVGWLAGITYGTFDGYLWLWGILDALVGLAAIYAGFDILRGGTFGRIVGVVIAGISAVRWWFYLPAAPYLGIVMIPVAIVIIYGLVVHGDYFDASQRDSGETV
jgi:hypothetical protein